MPLTLAILTDDTDFADSLADMAERELGCSCVRAQKPEGSFDVMVATMPVPAAAGIPVIELGHDKIRPAELLTRIQQLANAYKETVFAGWTLSARHKTLQGPQGGVIALTDKEIDIMQSLIESGGEGMTSESLLKAVWDFDSVLDTHTLQTHIYRLRGKLREQNGPQILSENGGYRLEAPV